MIDFNRFILSLFYIGDFKFAPGTLASIVTMIFCYFIPNIFLLQFFIIFLVVLIASILCEKHISKTNEKDPQYIVIDESIGMLISLFMVPKVLSYYLICFILFRIFDILKPSIIYRSQDYGNSLGIIIDDFLAGIFTLLIIWGYILS